MISPFGGYLAVGLFCWLGGPLRFTLDSDLTGIPSFIRRARWPAMLGALAVLLLTGCYDIQTSLVTCETHAQCASETDGEFDYCGQEGADVCCTAGFYKCGCIGDRSCESGYTCYACNGDVCANNQPTICLDVFGSVAGLTPVDG